MCAGALDDGEEEKLAAAMTVTGYGVFAWLELFKR
jgi:hypothetical protein